MRTVYAVQFEVGAPLGSSPASVPERVRKMAADWVADWYTRSRLSVPDIPLDGCDLQPVAGHAVKVQRVNAGGHAGLWNLTWSHPADHDDTLLWTSECLVASAEGRTEVSIILRLESTAFRIAPSQFEVWRPRLVRRLVDELPCKEHGRLLTASPQLLAVADVGQFVENELLSPARALPAILFSRDIWSEMYVADPAATADAVVGLARVYFLTDKWAAFALTNDLGKTLSCFGGAVRIYWPGLTQTADPYSQPLFLPDRIRGWEADGRRLPNVILRRLAPISAVRFMQGPITKRVRAALDIEETHRREQVKRGLVDRAELEGQLLEAWDGRDRARRELEEREASIVELELRIAELEEENRDLKTSFAQIRQHIGVQGQGVSQPVKEVEVDFRSVREALDRAGQEFRDHIDVWRSAEESAVKSAFARPSQVYQALLAIKEVAEAYFKSKATGRSMGPWDKAFTDKGFKYAATESQNTLNMYGDERVFVHKGQKLQMLRHITMGGGDRQNCLQIYFEVHEGLQRVMIGYCGMHLPYYGMTT
jgi:hypothetical protein